MIPRAVQMAKAVSDIIGPSETDLGNILGPVVRKGWSNNFSEVFLGDENTLGNPTMYSYRVHSWLEGQPRWSHRPVKKFDMGFNAVMHPVADTLTPPPLTNITGFGG